MKKLLVLLMLALAFSSTLMAGVSLKNGNFYIDYTDIVVPGGGHDIVISRTYNSRAMDKGWFGFGWGSDFETYLKVEADGSVIVHENGSGARTRFVPRIAIDPIKAAKKIVEAMRKKRSASLSENLAKDLIKKLAGDEELRQAYSKRFSVRTKLPKGTVLFSNVRGMQKLVKLKKGYKRSYNDGKQEYFDEYGKYLKFKDKTGYTINLKYKNNKVTKIKDSQGKQVFLDWYSNGFVKHIWSAGDKKTYYEYKGENLVSSKDVDDNAYKYSYDSIHNMLKITYKDGKSMDIKYDPKSRYVHVVKKRSGNKIKYEYGSNPKNPDDHYWTSVSKKSVGGKWKKNRYEYEMRSRPDGSKYTYRIITEINGFKTSTVYSECCGLPLKIKKGKHVTTFDYNSKGLLTKKTSTRGEYVELKYHPTLNKITEVINNKGWTKFNYDKKGNLTKAVNDKGKSVLLIYDRKGRIVKMVDYNKRTKKKRGLAFRYNSQGKPIEIAMTKVGKIFVSYDNYGEIKRVDSKQGHKMALQVTQAFQSLISIVKPAGVNFNM